MTGTGKTGLAASNRAYLGFAPVAPRWLTVSVALAIVLAPMAHNGSPLAVGVNTDGRREVLGMAIGASEAEPFWTELPHATSFAEAWPA